MSAGFHKYFNILTIESYHLHIQLTRAKGKIMRLVQQGNMSGRLIRVVTQVGLWLLLLTAINPGGLAADQVTRVGSWGDQNNGKYKNPVLEANYPDNDVMKCGEYFYMMSSNNHLTPGMVILKSSDLVNWVFSNYILPAPITFDRSYDAGRNPSMENNGTWAGSFGYDGATYFAYWCFNKNGLGTKGTPAGGYHIVYAKAKTLEGPWTTPQELTWPDGKPIQSTDPGVFWDLDTHKAWIVMNDSQIYPLAWDGSKLLKGAQDGISITTDLRGEAGKLYKFDGMYFYMNAHWAKHDGVNQRMATFHRAKNIEGPWEGKIVLANGNGTTRSPSQGSLLKLADGTWWFMHQLARGEPAERYNGRPQCLEPVAWKDGWPLIGVDTNNDGIGEVVWEHDKPIQGAPIAFPATSDDFNSPVLGLQWNWIFNPKMERWSLTERPGFLRLKSSIAAESGILAKAPNVIVQRLVGRHANVMTAKLDLTEMANGQKSGLVISAIISHAIGVSKDANGRMGLYFQTETRKKNTKSEVIAGPVMAQQEIWLQATVEDGLAKFLYSLDGKEFTQLGKDVQLEFVGFTGNAVGFYCQNEREAGAVDIDWFTYRYDGPGGG